jgi:hypothetical protein
VKICRSKFTFFSDIEDNDTRTAAINEFVDIVQSLPYRCGVEVLTAIRERVILDYIVNNRVDIDV